MQHHEKRQRPQTAPQTACRARRQRGAELLSHMRQKFGVLGLPGDHRYPGLTGQARRGIRNPRILCHQQFFISTVGFSPVNGEGEAFSTAYGFSALTRIAAGARDLSRRDVSTAQTRPQNSKASFAHQHPCGLKSALRRSRGDHTKHVLNGFGTGWQSRRA